MKRPFPLKAEGKHPDRLLESTKNEIRKYVRREKRRDLPEGFDYWDFNCAFGKTETTTSPIHVADITKNIDIAKAQDWDAFFIVILRDARKRTQHAPAPNSFKPSDNTDSPT